MLSVPFLRSASFFPPNNSIEADMAVAYTVYSLFFQKIPVYQGFWYVVSGKYDP